MRKKKETKDKAPTAHKGKRISAPVYDTARGPGLRSWRLWAKRRSDGVLIEIGRVAAFGPVQAVDMATEKAKEMAKILGDKYYFCDYLSEDITKD